MKRLFTSIIISLTLCFFLSPTNSLAGQATLAWDPPYISADVTGYMIHYGTASGTYSQSGDVGNATSYTVSNLSDGQKYYFAVTAYNAVGYQSVYSNEVSLMTSPQQYLLMTLNPGPGQGTVSGSGISCGNTCFAVYKPGTVVSLSATATAGSTFDGWSGAGCSGTGLCTVTINGNTAITANFKPSTATTTFNAALYFPHVATSLPWQTEIAIINTSDQTVTGTLRALSDEGQLIETKAVTLSARGRRQITVADEFTNHTNIGYIIFDTNSDAVQGYTKFYREGIYRAAIPAVKEVNTSDIYISHIASER